MLQASGVLRVVVIAFSIVVAGAAGAATEPFSSVPAPVQSFDAGKLHVDQFGAGERSLILIPGLAGGAWVWSDTIAKFSPSYTVYVITLPGFDGTAASDEKPLFATCARDFWAMLPARKIEKPVIIGHSLGGTLAIALGEEHAERLGGVIAVDGLPVFPMAASATAEQREAMGTRMAEMYGSLSKEAVFTAQKEFMSKVGTRKAELVEPAARRQARSEPAAIGAWMREALTSDLRPNLGKVTVPLLEIMPFDDAEAKAGQTQERKLAFYKSLLAGAPKASVVAVAPARHFVMLDQPEAFCKAVEAFLAGEQAASSQKAD
jgi:pimeloyl-ACP methyl ester carboxylesterase